MGVKVSVDFSALRALRQQPEKVLRELDMAVVGGARAALDASAFLVPRGDPSDDSDLAGTGFVSGPHHNLGPPLSTTATAGYDHHAAGAVHEGFHWGIQTQKPPPHFLRKAFRRVRAATRKAIAARVASVLARLFPSR